MLKKLILLKLVEAYRKSISIMWLISTIGFSTLITWLFNIIFKKSNELKVDFIFHSKQVSLYLESTLTDIILLTEMFFLEVYYIEHIKEPNLIIDAGSNKGLAAVYFGLLWPESTIHCFEPNKQLIPILKKNLEVNNIHAKVFNYAISNKEGIAFFDISNNHQYSKLVNEKTNNEVKTIHLESFYPDQHIDILKLDVEGAEEKIISSLHAFNIHCIIGEVHHKLIDEENFFRLLSEKYVIRKPRLQQYLSNPTVKYPIVTAIRRKE